MINFIMIYVSVGCVLWGVLMMGATEDWKELVVECVLWPRLIYKWMIGF